MLGPRGRRQRNPYGDGRLRLFGSVSHVTIHRNSHMRKIEIEVITSVERRRRWSAAEKERLGAASLELGQAAAGGGLSGWKSEKSHQRFTALGHFIGGGRARNADMKRLVPMIAIQRGD